MIRSEFVVGDGLLAGCVPLASLVLCRRSSPVVIIHDEWRKFGYYEVGGGEVS